MNAFEKWLNEEIKSTEERLERLQEQDKVYDYVEGYVDGLYRAKAQWTITIQEGEN